MHTDEFTDLDSRMLLKLLFLYQETFSPDLPQTISALAEDLAMSLDKTTDEDEQWSLAIQKAWDK